MPQYTYKHPSHIFPKTITSERLIFKHITPHILSIQDLHKKYAQLDPETTQYTSFEPHTTLQETLNWIHSHQGEFENGSEARYFIFPKDATNYSTDNLIGTTGIEPDWKKNTAESGIFLFKEYWGNGYSTERGKTMIDLTFTQLNLQYYLSRFDPDNTQSEKAIRKYILPYGGKKIGKLPTKNQNLSSDQVAIYKLTKTQYQTHTE